MNLKNILKENGYEIVTEFDMTYLKLKFTEDALKEKLKNRHLYDYDVEGTFNVKIREVGFDGEGYLYIVLDCTDDEHFQRGSCFDIIVYGEEVKA